MSEESEKLKRRVCESIDSIQKWFDDPDLALETRYRSSEDWILYTGHRDFNKNLVDYDWRIRPKIPLTPEQAKILKDRVIIDRDINGITVHKYHVMECYGDHLCLLPIPYDDRFRSVKPLSVSYAGIVDWEQPDGIQLYR